MSARKPRPRPQPLWLSVEVGQFAAQALERARPGLRGSAFVVLRQSRDSHRAAVQAVSAGARDLGVEPGTLLFAMRRAHRGRVAVVDRDESAEAAAAESVTAVLERWTPSFRARRGWARLSALLDLGGTPAARAGGWRAAGAELQRQLAGASGLGEIAVGVSTARLVARVLGRQALPGGVVLCAPGDEDRVLARTELADLPGLGPVCRERAARYGIHTVGQVLPLDRRALRRRFGRRTGERLYGVVRGLEVEARPGAPGAIEAETVLREDANDDGLLRAAVALTVDRACHELRLRGLAAKSLTLRIAYTDDRRARRTSRLPAGHRRLPGPVRRRRGAVPPDPRAPRRGPDDRGRAVAHQSGQRPAGSVRRRGRPPAPVSGGGDHRHPVAHGVRRRRRRRRAGGGGLRTGLP